MKRYTLFIVAFVAAFSLIAGPAFSAVYVTPKLDLGYGLSDWHQEGADINPMLGGGVIVGFNLMPALSLEGSIAYQYWFTEDDSYTYSHVPFMIGARIGLGMFGLVGGLGGVYRSIDTDIFDYTETVFGFYLGVDVVISNVMIRAQYVYAGEGDDYTGAESSAIELSIGYKFGV